MKLETLSAKAERAAEIAMIRGHGDLVTSAIGVELYAMPGGSVWLIQDDDRIFLGTRDNPDLGALGPRLAALAEAMTRL